MSNPTPLPEINDRAVAMYSGGLDSILAVLLLEEQGIDVLVINFQSPFYGQPVGAVQSKLYPIRTAEKLGFSYRIVAKGIDFLDLLRNPAHGFGKNMNPCVDCKIYMMTKVREIMVEENRSFLITGEVLGQRPMSQRLDTFKLMEKTTGLTGRILRPLCAGRLVPTEPEISGIVDRGKLLSIMGRGRLIQMEEVAKRGITEYPSPAGGCLLTDPGFSRKLAHLMKIVPEFRYTDIHLLKIGRHIRLGDHTKAVISRNQGETMALEHMKPAGQWYLEPMDFTGPDAIIVGPSDAALRDQVAAMIGRYGKLPEAGGLVHATHGENVEEHRVTTPYDDGELRKRLI